MRELRTEKIKRSELWVVVAAILAIVGVVYLVLNRDRLFATPSPQPTSTVVVTQVESSTLPGQFPEGFPLSAASSVIDNYNAQSKENDLQATRTFESGKSVAENFAFYRQYLQNQKNGWILLDELTDDPDVKALFGQNEKGFVSINITSGADEKSSIVDISFVVVGEDEPAQ